MKNEIRLFRILIEYSSLVMIEADPKVENPEEAQPTVQTWVDRHFSYNALIVLFFCMNLLNYMERVVVSGSSEKILEFIRRTVPSHENTYFGALTSGFICGFSIASVLFGYWVTKWDPFKVVSVGLICWFVAAIMSGLAPNYWVLLLARMISGVGEAAFQIVVPSYINEKSPKDKLGSSMALLYAAISIGTALGFMLSGWVSQYYSWRYMYLFAAPLMLPAIIIVYFITYTPKATENDKTTFAGATCALLKMPLFILSFLAEAADVFVCGAYLAFGNQLLIHIGFFDDEATSSLVYGALCCGAGVVGSILGGWALNRYGVKETDSQAKSLLCFSKHFFVCAVISGVFCSFTAFLVHQRTVFLIFFFLGFVGIFMSNISWTLVVLNTAPPLVRPMAMAVATVFYHLCGDVPAPVITGRFLDAWLHWAGENEHRRWLAYLYTHWFILSALIFFILFTLFICILAKRKWKKEEDKDKGEMGESLLGEYPPVVVNE